MHDTAALAARYDATFALHFTLCDCFNRFAAGDRNDEGLEKLIEKTLQAVRLDTGATLEEQLNVLLSKLNTMTLLQAEYLTNLAETAQDRIRQLLISPEAIMNPDGGAPSSDAKAGARAQISSLHDHLVPYACDASRVFLNWVSTHTADTPPDGDLARAEKRREEAVKAHDTLNEVIKAPGLAMLRLRGWGKPVYPTPRAAYDQNTTFMARLHLDIADKNMARCAINITLLQATMRDRPTLIRRQGDPTLQEAYGAHLYETRFMFTMTALHLYGGLTRFGHIDGARQFIERSKARPLPTPGTTRP